MAAATGLSIETVALYQPLLFPLALQLGGFFFLAYGLAPRREVAMKQPQKAETPEATKPAAKKATAAKPIKATTKKPKALPRPPLLLPAGAVHFDRRAAMRAEL